MIENNKYILDRIDNFFSVFLQREDESKQLLIPKSMIKVLLEEGDIVEIEKNELGYEISVLKEETVDMRDKVSSLLEKLKNKKV